MVTSRFRFSHSSLSLSCRTESFDSYAFDSEGCEEEGSFQQLGSDIEGGVRQYRCRYRQKSCNNRLIPLPFRVR